MKRSFVETTLYSKTMDTLPDRDVVKASVEKILLENPSVGELVPGTGGLRKIRLASQTKGKRGAYRVVYYDHSKEGEVYLIFIYSKSSQEDLTPEGKKVIKKLIEQIKGTK